jgi:hypothetical protein
MSEKHELDAVLDEDGNAVLDEDGNAVLCPEGQFPSADSTSPLGVPLTADRLSWDSIIPLDEAMRVLGQS